MRNQTRPELQSDIRVVLDELVAGTSRILGENFIGAWLQGSLATGDFDEYSDIDFAIGVERDLSDAQLEALQRFHPQLYAHQSAWSEHLEGSYYPREILRDYKRSDADIWYLDHGSKELVRSSHDNTVAVKWILREKGVVLAGPDPSTLINPIPTDALRVESYRAFAEWGRVILENPDEISSHFYQSFTVLSYCRMLRDLHKGEIGSKRAGAEWVKSNWDDTWHDLIDRAWLGRPNPFESVNRSADREDHQRTLAFVNEALAAAKDLMRELGL